MSKPNLDGADSPAIGISANSRLTPGTPYMSAAATSAVPARNATRQRTCRDAHGHGGQDPGHVAGIRLLLAVVGQPGTPGRVPEDIRHERRDRRLWRNDHWTDGEGPPHRGDAALAHVLEEGHDLRRRHRRAQQDGGQQATEEEHAVRAQPAALCADETDRDRVGAGHQEHLEGRLGVSGQQRQRGQGREQRDVARAAVATIAIDRPQQPGQPAGHRGRRMLQPHHRERIQEKRERAEPHGGRRQAKAPEEEEHADAADQEAHDRVGQERVRGWQEDAQHDERRQQAGLIRRQKGLPPVHVGVPDRKAERPQAVPCQLQRRIDEQRDVAEQRVAGSLAIRRHRAGRPALGPRAEAQQDVRLRQHPAGGGVDEEERDQDAGDDDERSQARPRFRTRRARCRRRLQHHGRNDSRDSALAARRRSGSPGRAL